MQQEGTISKSAHSTRTSVQGELEKKWSERMGKEDKIMTTKYETLNSTVERLAHEITSEREESGERGEHRGHILRKRAGERGAQQVMEHLALRVGVCRLVWS